MMLSVLTFLTIAIEKYVYFSPNVTLMMMIQRLSLAKVLVIIPNQVRYEFQNVD